MEGAGVVAVAFLLMWGGYGLADFGWCLFRDYDVTLGQLMSPLHPYDGPWPPATIPASQIWPGGTSAASSGTASSTASTPTALQSAISAAEKYLKEIT
jgi:hypothetical protein